MMLTNVLDELLKSLACHGEPVEALKKGLTLLEVEKVVSQLPYIACLFPILALEDRCFYSVQGSSDISPPLTGLVYDDLIDTVPIPIAASLLTFFKSLLECWDTGVYSINPAPRQDWGIYDDFVIHNSKEEIIFAKNGSLSFPRN